MTASTMFSLQFVRKAMIQSQDDRAVITCIGADKYKIIYSDATVKHKMFFETNGYGVLRWIRRILRLLEEDVDPFEYLQLNLPAMPSTMFSISNLSNNYTTILNAVEFYLDDISKMKESHSPEISQPITPPATPISRECPHAPIRRHLFFDESGNEEYRRPAICERDFNY